MYDIIFEILLARLFLKIIYCLYAYTTVYKHNNDYFYSTIFILCSIQFFNVPNVQSIFMAYVNVFINASIMFFIFFIILYM